jgi:UDP-N-acetylglucosamine 2-epimerase (non-hydrolysing)/GDP/UDP-N,N'-diacetylbacillosamine 2-epimerase (hydrolysing)
MSAPRKIAIFTGNRAEYGLQLPILRAIAADPRLEYFLLAGGAHLVQDFGRTIAEIESDGFTVHRQVRVPAHPPTRAYTARSIASGVEAVSAILEELEPDFMLVYADRFESFAAAIAATQMNIPTAHVEGGDYTEGGALDDSVRHAMTKLAHLHFTTNGEASERVLKLGEEPWRVFNVGFPMLDLVKERRFAKPDELIAEFSFDLSRPMVLFCQHAIASEQDLAAGQIRPSLHALEELAGQGFQIVVTYPNNDAGGEAIVTELERFAGTQLPGVHLVKSLGLKRFHGMLHLMGNSGRGVLAGNSSAGIKEARAFGCPCVNIGSRQRGRLRAANVLDAGYDAAAIADVIRKSVCDREFRALCRTCPNPYGDGNAGPRIAEVLATQPIVPALIQKRLTYSWESLCHSSASLPDALTKKTMFESCGSV